MFQQLVLFGKTINLYDTINLIGNICAFLLVACRLKEYKEFSTLARIPEELIKQKTHKDIFLFRWIFVFIEALFIFSVVWLNGKPVAHFISNLFLGDKSDNYFFHIYFLPVAFLLLGIIFRVSPLKLLDYLVLPNAVALIFYKIACFCFGCCYGVPTERFGMMNQCTDRKEFPIQLVELACAVVMLIVILYLTRKKDRAPGILYPLFIVMYCSSRFVSEFWRDDYPTVLGPLKGYHLMCIVGLFEGIIFLVVALKFGDKITEFFETKNKKLLERVCNKADKKKD